jgi:hypothetical protein
VGSLAATHTASALAFLSSLARGSKEVSSALGVVVHHRLSLTDATIPIRRTVAAVIIATAVIEPAAAITKTDPTPIVVMISCFTFVSPLSLTSG